MPDISHLSKSSSQHLFSTIGKTRVVWSVGGSRRSIPHFAARLLAPMSDDAVRTFSEQETESERLEEQEKVDKGPAERKNSIQEIILPPEKLQLLQTVVQGESSSPRQSSPTLSASAEASQTDAPSRAGRRKSRFSREANGERANTPKGAFAGMLSGGRRMSMTAFRGGRRQSRMVVPVEDPVDERQSMAVRRARMHTATEEREAWETRTLDFLAAGGARCADGTPVSRWIKLQSALRLAMVHGKPLDERCAHAHIGGLGVSNGPMVPSRLTVCCVCVCVVAVSESCFAALPTGRSVQRRMRPRRPRRRRSGSLRRRALERSSKKGRGHGDRASTSPPPT